MVVACVCFVGRQNEPLSLQFFDSEDVLSMQFAVYAALDTVEEKLQAQQPSSGLGGAPEAPPGAVTATAAGDCFLGAICPVLCLTRDYILYAYVCTTGLKILAAIEQRSQQPLQEIRSLFRRLHRLYADCVCNPLLLDTIETPAFLLQLDAIVKLYSKKLENGI